MHLLHGMGQHTQKKKNQTAQGRARSMCNWQIRISRAAQKIVFSPVLISLLRSKKSGDYINDVIIHIRDRMSCKAREKHLREKKGRQLASVNAISPLTFIPSFFFSGPVKQETEGEVRTRIYSVIVKKCVSAWDEERMNFCLRYNPLRETKQRPR